MKQTLILKGSLPGMNEIVALAKRGKGKYQPYAQEKADISMMIKAESMAQNILPLAHKANFIITWVCKDKRRDKDNVSAGCKFLLDGLQTAGVLKNDGWGEIGDITHKFEIGTPKVIIEMEEEV